MGRIASTTAVECYVVRGFNPGPTLTRPPSYYTPTGRRDGEGDDHASGTDRDGWSRRISDHEVDHTVDGTWVGSKERMGVKV